MWTHKERANHKKTVESVRARSHLAYSSEPAKDSAREAFKRPLFGGVTNKKKD